MRPSTKQLAHAKRVFTKNQSMLRTSDAIRLGIHPRTLYSLRDKGQIEQISRGLYRLKSAKPLANPDWATVAAKIPRGVICLISALSHHGLTTQVPHAVDIALLSHSRIPKLDFQLRRGHFHYGWRRRPRLFSRKDDCRLFQVQKQNRAGCRC
jgi:predicted transcriptional regulator of viral defense system